MHDQLEFILLAK